MTETKEVWVDIKEVDDDFIAYKISNKGRIVRNDGHLMRTKGNRVYITNRAGEYCSRSVALLVAKAFNLEIPQCTRACYIHHKDGDIENNCIDNLYWDEWYSLAEKRAIAKRKRVVLTKEWYKRLHIVEKRYGSVSTAPEDDPDWLWVKNKAQGLIK